MKIGKKRKKGKSESSHSTLRYWRLRRNRQKIEDFLKEDFLKLGEENYSRKERLSLSNATTGSIKINTGD